MLGLDFIGQVPKKSLSSFHMVCANQKQEQTEKDCYLVRSFIMLFVYPSPTHHSVLQKLCWPGIMGVEVQHIPRVPDSKTFLQLFFFQLVPLSYQAYTSNFFPDFMKILVYLKNNWVGLSAFPPIILSQGYLGRLQNK